MKLTWNKKQQKSKKRPFGALSPLPFGALSPLPFDQPEDEEDDVVGKGILEDNTLGSDSEGRAASAVVRREDLSDRHEELARSFQSQGDKLAEEGKYREALGKWENALTLMPDNAVLHEQKAQVLLEMGDAWSALKAAIRATELNPSWVEAWVTLGRSQLNFGEPDSAIESFDRALAIKPDSEDAQLDRKTAAHLINKRKHLHLLGMSASQNRFSVGDDCNVDSKS